MGAEGSRAEPYRGFHRVLKGELAPGTDVASGQAVTERIPLQGLLRCRIRIELTSGDGTLSAAFAKPDVNGSFDTPAQHALPEIDDEAVSGPDTEAMMEVDGLFGEAALDVTFTDTTGGSKIKQVTVSAL